MRHEIYVRGLDLVEKPHDQKLELVERKASILEKVEVHAYRNQFKKLAADQKMSTNW